MFDLCEFKVTKGVRGREVVNCLSAYYPKFTKAVESYASRPEDSGVQLTPDAVELLRCKFDADKYRKKTRADGMRQIRCRVSPEFAEKLNAMARKHGYTTQELLSGFIHDWYDTMVLVERLKGECE